MMKRRFFSLILSIAAVLCGIFAFSACDKKEKEPATEENGLSFQTLTVDGTNVYGKVSNATETFSFLEEITANGASKFIVALDIYGAQQVATKTIPLSVGDNTAYIMETIDGETVKMYTVTVRRRPIYTVSFDTIGGTAVQSQQVEEDSLATEPAAPGKPGYTFEKWDYDFSKPITQNASVSAAWKARTDTPYKVQYYLENADDNGYTLHETVDLQGETDTTATAQIKSYEHFSHKSTATDSGNINGNGTLVLKVYYTRDKYNVTFEGNGGTLQNGEINQILKYENAAVAPVFTRTGYTFIGWDKTIPESVCDNVMVTAQWKINQYTLTLIFENGQQDENITQDYDTNLIIPDPERGGYDFSGWDQEMPETMPAENITRTAKWKINQYTLTLIYGNGQPDKIIKQDYNTKLEISNPERAGYGFIGWDQEIPETMPAENITRTAKWKINQYTLTLIYGNGQPDKIIKQDYNTKLEISNPERAGYGFIGWDQEIPETMPAENITRTAKWNSASIFILSESGDTITGLTYDGKKYTEIGIPTEIDGIKITTIGNHAFYNCSGLKSVTIGNSVTSIGKSAFYDCSGLTNITIPNSVTSIGDGAFSGCSKLTYNEKDNLKYLGNSENLYLYLVGTSNKSITAANIDNNCKLIGNSAFSGCNELINVTIGNSVTSIGSSAFDCCSKLTNVTIPNSVTSIGRGAFRSCRGLTSVSIPNSVTSIWHDAFSGCSGLTNITIPDSVTDIYGNTFDNCSSLTSITIGNSVNYIHDAFWGCRELTKVYYRGNENEWNKITISSDDYALKKATKYYYSETKPEVEGNFWHYNDKNEIEEW